CARPRSRRTRRIDESLPMRCRSRPFSSAAAFSVKVTAQSRAGGSPSRRSSTHSSTRLCVLPVPAPAWMTTLANGHLAAVLVGIGGERDQPADGLQVAEIAAQGADLEEAAPHLPHALEHRAGQFAFEQRVHVNPV